MSFEGSFYFQAGILEPLSREVRDRLKIASEEVLDEIITKYKSVSLLEKVKRSFLPSMGCYRQRLEYSYAQNRDDIERTISEKELLLEEEKLRQEYVLKGRQVEFFSGSLEEFEKMKKKKYEIVDLKGGMKSITLASDFMDEKTYERIGELGMEAIVNVSVSRAFMNDPHYTGLPVKAVN